MNKEPEQILVEGQHGTGGYIDSYDSRDYHLSEVAGATLPFQWSVGYDVEKTLGFKIKVKDQGASFSCGGQAWSYLAEILEALATATYEPRSAKYIYAQTAVEGGGSYGRDNSAVLESQGVAREVTLSSYPATETNLTAAVDITTSVRNDAKNSVFYPYAHTENNIDSIAQAIRDHNGVLLGVDGMNNGTWTSAFPQPPTTTTWRHWVLAIKAQLIDGKKYIGIINSWGESVGEKGIQWLGENYFTSGHIFDNWTHVYKAQDLPQPFKIDMSYGQTSSEINKLQLFLEKLGYFHQETTGFYGNFTREAVFNFQKDNIQLSWWERYVLKGSKVGLKTRTALNLLVNN